MVHIFHTPWGVDETCEAIATTVRLMNGRVTKLPRGRLKAKWKTNLKKCGAFDHTCMFYVGEGMVRAVTDFKDTELIVMEFRKLTKPLKFWDIFLVYLTGRYPDVNFGVTPGIPSLFAIRFVDDGMEQVMVSKTINRPSLGGAALGGMLFGTAGAIIGGSSGKSYTTTTVRNQVSSLRYAMVMYSNGLIFRGKMINNGSLYQEIMANMGRLSDGADKL